MSSNPMLVRGQERPWLPHSMPVVVGKDILELLSSAMYVDPLTIYREYIQNSADAIDEAYRVGLLPRTVASRVDISIDPSKRAVRIRDNGTGIRKDEFEGRLLAFGASSKRGTNARGFRGVGRLSGLGYCQELIFRSRAAGESMVSEIKWDCRSIKGMSRDADSGLDLQAVVHNAIGVRLIPEKGWPEHFFEVELRGVIRHKNDVLLNAVAVYDYLAEVSPVPFSPEFENGAKIIASISEHVNVGEINIYIDGIKEQVYRPHRNEMQAKGLKHDQFSEPEFIKMPAMDGGLGAVGWILHHGYKGAVPVAQLKGLRLRSGNIQVGGSDLLQELFLEPRFNSWSVGEIHTIDKRIMPNGRRDHYEQNVHFNNLVNHISPHARNISILCRKSSIHRNLLRDFQRREDSAKEKLQVIKQGSLSLTTRKTLVHEVEGLIDVMRRISSRECVVSESKKSLTASIKKIERELAKARTFERPAKALAHLPASKRRAFEQVLGLVYECSVNQASAHMLVERILNRLG